MSFSIWLSACCCCCRFFFFLLGALSTSSLVTTASSDVAFSSDTLTDDNMIPSTCLWCSTSSEYDEDWQEEDIYCTQTGHCQKNCEEDTQHFLFFFTWVKLFDGFFIGTIMQKQHNRARTRCGIRPKDCILMFYAALNHKERLHPLPRSAGLSPIQPLPPM